MKKLIFLILVLFLISPILAQEQLVQVCGGDKEMVILCSGGNEELGYFHNFLDKLIGLGMNVSGKFVEEGNYIPLIICLLVLLLMIMSYVVYKKRKK